MKTNRIMDEIRKNISPEVKYQMELSMSIANRIYKILEERRMSQKEFAQKINKTETEVSRWLSGTHNLTLSTISKISVALGGDIISVTESAHQKDTNEPLAPDVVRSLLGAGEPVEDDNINGRKAHYQHLSEKYK